jgi:hypothetical protein
MRPTHLRLHRAKREKTIRCNPLSPLKISLIQFVSPQTKQKRPGQERKQHNSQSEKERQSPNHRITMQLVVVGKYFCFIVARAFIPVG